MYRLGILPMAGKAERWNGVHKELLPVGENKYLCDYALDAFKAQNVDTVAIVTTPQKIAMHAQHFSKPKYEDLNYYFVIQKGVELWKAIESCLLESTRATYTYFAMPDTVIPNDAFNGYFTDFYLGLFNTLSPERFSVVKDDYIYTKDNTLTGTQQKAWGVLAWDDYTAKHLFFYAGANMHYDIVFNKIMNQVPVRYGTLLYYYDLADWKAYRSFVEDQNI